MLKKIFILMMVVTSTSAAFYCLPVAKMCQSMMSGTPQTQKHSCCAPTTCPCTLEKPSGSPADLSHQSFSVDEKISSLPGVLSTPLVKNSFSSPFQSLKSPHALPLYQAFSVYRL